MKGIEEEPAPRDTAIRRAMALFWSRGAEVASYNEIVEATGLSRKALYALWPEKDALVHDAMALYRQVVLAPLVATLRVGGRKGVEAFWNALERGVRTPGWSGCFLFRSASGALREDSVIAGHFRAHVELLRKEVAKAVMQGIEDGEIATIDAETAAWQTVSVAALISTYGAISGNGKPVQKLIAAGRTACGLG